MKKKNLLRKEYLKSFDLTLAKIFCTMCHVHCIQEDLGPEFAHRFSAFLGYDQLL